MSLIKNLKRREVEIFGAKRVVRNDSNKKKETTQEKPKRATSKRKNVEVK